MNQKSVINALGGLISWLETWRTAEGAYNGFVIHRANTKRMSHIHDTAWTQAAIIRGYANLYRKSREPRWHDALVLAADLQASRFEPETGKYRFAGHEDDRFCSLVHCALANSALLGSCGLVKEQRRERYVGIVRENVNHYWMPSLWVEEEGAFRFSKIDYYSINEHRFVINFNTMAVETLLKLADITGDSRYREIALHVGQWLIEKCDHARQFHTQLLSKLGKAGDNCMLMPLGGLPYQYTATQRNPDNCVTIYNGLALRGICSLYRATEDEAYATITRETAEFLLAMRDPETRLFYHTTWRGRIEPYPQFIAGAGMTLNGLHEALPLVGEQVLAKDTVEKILAHAHPNGSFPSFIGKDRGNRRKGTGVVWEDVVASVNWNAQLFEYLTRLVDAPSAICVTRLKSSVRIGHKRFFYFDMPQGVSILSWWPPRSWGFYIIKKRSPRAWLSFNPRPLLSAIKSRIGKVLGKAKCLKYRA